MDFFEAVEQRQSIRAFESRPVEEEKLRKILETANAAPSAGNLQAYEIYVVRKRQDRAALARAALHQDFVASAPVVLVFCTHPARSSGKYGARGARLYSVQDATIACAFAMLAVTSLGLASVWVGAFRDEGVREALRLSDDLQPVALLPVGYPAESPERAERRTLADLVHEV